MPEGWLRKTESIAPLQIAGKSQNRPKDVQSLDAGSILQAIRNCENCLDLET